MRTKRHPGNLSKAIYRFFDGKREAGRGKRRTSHPFPLLPSPFPALKAVLTLLLVTSAAQAAVKATVDNPAVFRGDPVTLTLSASGNDIRFPALNEIAGYPIRSRGTSRNISIINGRTTRTVEQRLVFVPQKSVTIPALDITVDGRLEHTLPLRVKVLEPKAAPKGAPVQMQMKLSKSEAYVGEPIELDLVFKYKPGTKIDDIQISEPKLDNFWIKRLNQKAERGADNDGYITQTYRYLLFAQQSGELKIPAIFAQIGTRVQSQRGSMFGDAFFNDPFFGGGQMRYKKVYSNPAVLTAKALPQGLEVYGDFTLHANVDKTKVHANKPVNLHIHIEGHGNVEDIPKFDPQIDNAVVYANDPVTKGYVRNGRYYGTFDQTIAIIPDRNITVPPMEFRYFDSKTETVVTKTTPPFSIEVTGAAPQPSAPIVQGGSPVESAPASTPRATAARGGFDLYEALGIFATGFAGGALTIWLFGLWGRERPVKAAKETPMAKKIKAVKDDRALFELLLPLKGSAPAVDEALEKLEANLYHGAKNVVDRKVLAAHFDGQENTPVELI